MTATIKISADLPTGSFVFLDQPVNQLLTHNAILVGAKSNPHCLDLHSSLYVTDLSPQLSQLHRVLAHKQNNR